MTVPGGGRISRAMSKRPSHDPGSTPSPSSPDNVVSWEEARLKQTLPRVIGRCMSFSAAATFDESLIAAVRRFYGIDVDVATAETDILEDDFERVRFFPWFLWDFTLARAGSVGERFAADGELSDYERALVKALVDSCTTFAEVVATDVESGLVRLRDLARDDEVVTRDASLATELEAGQVTLLRLVRLPGMRPLLGASAPWASLVFASVDAIYAVLPPEALVTIGDELSQLLGVRGAAVTPLLKEKAPELLDLAEHILHTLTEPPTQRNVDDEAIVLCRTVAPATPSEALEVALECGLPFTRRNEALWVWEDARRVVGWLRRTAQGFLVEAGSRERLVRFTALLGDLGVKLPALHSEQELARAGAEWLATGESDEWLTDPEVEAAFRGQLGEWLDRWPDQPHPALGRRTPREVKAEPGGDLVVARLVQRVRKVAGDAAGAQLASLLA